MKKVHVASNDTPPLGFPRRLARGITVKVTRSAATFCWMQSVASTKKKTAQRHAERGTYIAMHTFKPGDRVELVRYYSFWGEPLPQGTVISTSDHTINTKMDRNGRMRRLSPDDLRVVPPKPKHKPTSVGSGRDRDEKRTRHQ